MIQLLNIVDASAMIASGATLHIAGDEDALSRLPKGNWIGGTIPYFITPEGGRCDRQNLLVTPLDRAGGSVRVVTIGLDALAAIATDAPANGFTLAIIPGMTDIHKAFALQAPEIPEIFEHPLVGWIAGVHLDDLGACKPKAFDGTTGIAHDDRIVALRVDLPPGRIADIGIVNIFEPGDGETICFPETAFEAKEAIIGGERVDFAKWLTDRGVDTRFPLVADYSGEKINVSFQAVDREAGVVRFYAPVVTGVDYKLAVPVTDYKTDLAAHIAEKPIEPLFGCNCILNYLYGGLEGQTGIPIPGPATFGEVAYMLLNQTLVYLDVRNR